MKRRWLMRLRAALIQLLALVVIAGCTDSGKPTPTPDIPATVVAATKAAMPTATPAPTQTPTPTLTPTPGLWSIVVLPDTQHYVESFPAILTAQTQWIAANKDLYNIVFVLHGGDITDNNTDVEWQRASTSMSTLDEVVPYALPPGNHDMGPGGDASSRDTTLYNSYFPVSRYETLPTFGGVFEPGKLDNSYHLFSSGGADWLVLALEFGPRDQVLAWANRVVAGHPNRRVIVVTHTYLYSDDTLHGSDPTHRWDPRKYGVVDEPGGVNDGVEMWNKFIRRHRNISFVFSAHVLNDGTGRSVHFGDNRNKVYQMVANYQGLPNGGNGFLRLVEFDPNQKMVSVKTYSPYLDEYKTDPENQFVFENVYLGPPNTASPTVPTDTTPPAAPANLTSTGITTSRIDIRWRTASDPESAISYYIIFRDGVEVGTSPGTAFLDVDLTKATKYTYQVFAVNGDGLRGPGSTPSTGTPSSHLLFDDFSDGDMIGWTVVDEGTNEAPSNWSVPYSRLIQSSNIYGGPSMENRRGTFAYWNDPLALSWTDYTYEVKMKSSDNDGIGIMFRYQDPDNYYKVELDRERNFRKLFKRKDGVETVLSSTAVGYDMDTDMILSVRVVGSEITVTLDGTDLFGGPITDRDLATGTVALYSWANAWAVFDDLRVTTHR